PSAAQLERRTLCRRGRSRGAHARLSRRDLRRSQRTGTEHGRRDPREHARAGPGPGRPRHAEADDGAAVTRRCPCRPGLGRDPPRYLVACDTQMQMLALLERADCFVGPGSGPIHIDNALGTKVIGLYACTDPARSGPYSDLRFTTNHYDEAARRFLKKPAQA